MAIGLDLNTEYAERAAIPSGGAGTLSEGGFADFFAGVWLYRPSATATRLLTADAPVISCQASARNVIMGFNGTGSLLADCNLQITYNSGGGVGSPFVFTGYAGNSFLDEWVYIFVYENSANSLVAGYIRLADLNTAVTNAYVNDNATSQFVNTLTFGNGSGHTTGLLGYYAYARARASASITAADVLTYASSDATISGDWGFWPLANNTDTGDTSGNARTLTFSTGLTSETSPTLAAPVVLAAPMVGARRVGLRTARGGIIPRLFAPVMSATPLAATNVTAALTSSLATGSVGTVSPSADKALTSSLATGSVGSVVPSLDKALTGVAVTATVGAVTATVDKALTSASAAGAVGSVGVAVSVALTGVAATGEVGTVTVLTAGATAALTSVSATGQAGSVSPSVDKALTGASGAATVGAVAPVVDKAITGAAAAGSAGSVAPSSSKALTSATATAAVGSVGANVSVALSGVSATGAVGTVTAVAGVTAALTGTAATGGVGSVGVAVTVALSGVQAAGQAGSVSVPGAVVVGDVPGIDISFVSHAKPRYRNTDKAEAQKREILSVPPKPKKVSDETKAEVRSVIETAAKLHVEQGAVRQSTRYAEVRAVLKPYGAKADFNWPALYESLYRKALDEALKAELQREFDIQEQAAQQQAADDDEIICLLLLSV